MEKINIAELLKDCPSGMELDCTMCDNVYFDKVLIQSIRCYYIKDNKKTKNTIYFNHYGKYLSVDNGKCVIFPKGKTTWEGFVPPYMFKDGDIIYVESKSYSPGLISIFKKEDSRLFYDYCAVSLDGKSFYLDNIYGLIQKDVIAISRFATEEEKAKLFKAIEDNGYKWNPESKTLEELELVPNKFDINTLKPFDKMLVRQNDMDYWKPAFWGRCITNNNFPFITTYGATTRAIPFKNNEHLLGTTNDCDEFYKNW